MDKHENFCLPLRASRNLRNRPMPSRWRDLARLFAIQQKGTTMGWMDRKKVLGSLGCVIALAAAGAAVAYFTSSGSGTGSAEVGSSSAVTLHATISADLYPGASSPVTLTVDNPSSGSQRVGTVSLSSISADSGHSACSTTISGGNPDFTMPAVTVNKVFPSGNGQSVTPNGTLTMNETGLNQDACQGATLTMHLANN
jgi:hypothetical protein